MKTKKLKTHTYHARYGLERTVTHLGKGQYLVEGLSHYMRGADNMIDFEGGPFLMIGSAPYTELGKPPFMTDSECILKLDPIDSIQAFQMTSRDSSERAAVPESTAFVMVYTNA